MLEKINTILENLSIKREEKVNEKILLTESIIQKMNDFISTNEYLDSYQANEMLQYHLNNYSKEYLLNASSKAKNYKELETIVNEYSLMTENFLETIKKINKKIIEEKMNDAKLIIGKINGFDLDNQQLASIVKEEQNQLVLAGAGTGKTTTIVGKVKYLLKSGYEPKDLLLLSFTKASSSDLTSDLRKENVKGLLAQTFHKTGLDIIKEVEGNSPDLHESGPKEILTKILSQLLEDEKYRVLLMQYFIDDKNEKNELDFNDKKSYDYYLKLNPPITIKRERVKSYGELEIANYLTLHGIDYVYEKKYKYETKTKDYLSYYPDFYLPKNDVYIEYFGLDRQGRVAPYIKGNDEKTGSELYQESIKWKRKLHRDKKTKMIELFSYEKFEETLSLRLEEELKKNNIVSEVISFDDFIASMPPISGIGNLESMFEKIINNIKRSGYDYSEIVNLIDQSSDKKKNLELLNISWPLYKGYNKGLELNNKIDFNDMIAKATEYVKKDRYKHNYKMVIVDEYQDMSRANFELLKALKNQKKYKIFAVGDDWQSIYRFNGSKINYIVDFKEYWGITDISKIETTYRFSNALTEISGQFIMKNNQQLRKNIRGKFESPFFPLTHISAISEKEMVEKLVDALKKVPINKTVYLIGRNKSDINTLLTHFELEPEKKRQRWFY